VAERTLCWLNIFHRSRIRDENGLATGPTTLKRVVVFGRPLGEAIETGEMRVEGALPVPRAARSGASLRAAAEILVRNSIGEDCGSRRLRYTKRCAFRGRAQEIPCCERGQRTNSACPARARRHKDVSVQRNL